MNNCTLPKHCVTAISRHLRPDLFKALSDPTRLSILVRVVGAAGPLTVSEASTCCGVHFSGVSRHLKLLRDAGLLEAEKQGRDVVYRPKLTDLVATLRGLADAIEDCQTVRECCANPQGEEHGRE